MAEGITIVAVIAGIIGFAWSIVVATGRRTVRNLTAAGSRLGLAVAPERFAGVVIGASLHGLIQGRPVRLWSYTTGSGKSQTTWAAVGVTPRRTGGLEFRLARQGIVTMVKELFGAREITVGDSAFDRAWFVQTNRPEYLAAALVPEIREKLLAVDRAGGDGHFRLEGGEVVYAERGSLGSARVVTRLESVVSVTLDLADVAEVSAAAG